MGGCEGGASGVGVVMIELKQVDCIKKEMCN